MSADPGVAPSRSGVPSPAAVGAGTRLVADESAPIGPPGVEAVEVVEEVAEAVEVVEAVEASKAGFIEFMVRSDVLRFGDFVTKSGRRTPYFLETGRYRTGEQLARLGDHYASAITRHWFDGVDILFGPAYKAIPLVTATAIALAGRGRSVRWCFNRKEAKDHGEGGMLVGALPRDGDRVVIVEDVTTAGTSIRETVPLLRAVADVEIIGLIVAVDRQERGLGERSALVEVAEEFDMSAHAIVDLDEIIGHLHGHRIDGRLVLDDTMLERMIAYRRRYGPRS